MDIPENKKGAMRMMGLSNILNDLAQQGEREVSTPLDGIAFIKEVLDLFDVEYAVEELEREPDSTLPPEYQYYKLTMKDALWGD